MSDNNSSQKNSNIYEATIGNESFAFIQRSPELLYVDKTDHIPQLMKASEKKSPEAGILILISLN